MSFLGHYSHPVDMERPSSKLGTSLNQAIYDKLGGYATISMAECLAREAVLSWLTSTQPIRQGDTSRVHAPAMKHLRRFGPQQRDLQFHDSCSSRLASRNNWVGCGMIGLDIPRLGQNDAAGGTRAWRMPKHELANK